MVWRPIIKTAAAEQKKQNNQKNDNPHRVSPVEAARDASFGCLVLTPADAQSPKKGSATGGAWRFRAYQEQQGFGGNHISAGAETALLTLRTRPSLTSSAATLSSGFLQKPALYSAAGRCTFSPALTHTAQG